jgi:hypothetical protein
VIGAMLGGFSYKFKDLAWGLGLEVWSFYFWPLALKSGAWNY